MYMYMYIWTSNYMYIYIYVYIYVFVYVYMFMYLHISTYMYICLRIYTKTCLHISSYMHIYADVRLRLKPIHFARDLRQQHRKRNLVYKLDRIRILTSLYTKFRFKRNPVYMDYVLFEKFL